MGKGTAIEWADHTFNPVWGCVEVSPACDHCYAKAWDKRTGGAHWGPHAPLRTFGDKHWNEPLKWNLDAERDGVRRRVFCASMADVFDNRWPADIRPRLWELIRATPALTWMLLTKRPQNIAGMLPADWGDGWPNVWLGTTVENREEAERRLTHLLRITARIRFASYEPALGPVPAFGGIDWIISGGESGPKARPPHPDWFRQARDIAASTGAAFHFKQWGEWAPRVDRDRDDPDWRAEYTLTDRKPDRYRILNLAGGLGFHGERVHMMERVGKKAAGRLLDGREHNEFPQAQPA